MNPADPILQRAEALLAHGRAAVDLLGKGGAPVDGMAQLEALSQQLTGLRQVNSELLPLISRLQRPGGQPNWWRSFTGEQLEHEVFFEQVKQQIETLAQQGQAQHDAMARQVTLMQQQHQLLTLEVAMLEQDIAAARLLAGNDYARARAAAEIGNEDLARLIRRADNLDAMATTTRLTQAQFQLAIEHARAMADRYREIRTVLLPIWQQNVGFELFAARMK
jgi:hypothetical protein